MPIALTCRKFDNDSFLQSLKSRLIDRPLRSDTPNARKSPTYLLQIQLTDADQNFSWSSDGIVALQAVLPIFGCPAEPAPDRIDSHPGPVGRAVASYIACATGSIQIAIQSDATAPASSISFIPSKNLFAKLNLFA